MRLNHLKNVAAAAAFAASLVAVPSFAQITVSRYIIEDSVQDLDNFPFLEDSALEAGLLAIDATSGNLIFGENNVSGSGGNEESRVYSYGINANATADAATLELVLGNLAGTGPLQGASFFNTTNYINIRQSSGALVGNTVYFLAAADANDNQTEFVESADVDTVIALNLDTNTPTLVRAWDGASQIKAIGSNLYATVFDGTAASVQRMPISGASAPTVIVDEAAFRTALSAPTGSVFLNGMDVDINGNLLVLATAAATGVEPRIVSITNPGATAAIDPTPRVASAVLQSSPLGAVRPRGGFAVTASGRIVVYSADDQADVAATEGLLIINPAGTAVEAHATGAALIAGANAGSTGTVPTLQVFNPGVVAAEVGSNIVAFFDTQANEELIGKATFPLPVASSAANWTMYE